MSVTIRSDIESYLLLLLSMWQVLVILCIAMSLAFYGVLMRKTAIFLILFAIFIGVLGWECT
ncbi:hypothetical protein [Raoultella planticola]|uniref:hypothetical protein n=1 Tax=Raoultella planticola TaxID=575 RepID=UPI001F53253B|nr:hypothetical protein [Raoultella planticola]UNK75786.1 hypothetical protein MNO12_04190 [Raoultella planticola]